MKWIQFLCDPDYVTEASVSWFISLPFQCLTSEKCFVFFFFPTNGYKCRVVFFVLITWRPCGKTTTFSKWSGKSLHENPIGIFSTVSSIQNMTLVSEPTLIYAAVMLRLNIGLWRRPGIYFNRTITCGLSCTYNPWGIAHRSKPTWGSRTQLNKNKSSKIKSKRNFWCCQRMAGATESCFSVLCLHVQGKH